MAFEFITDVLDLLIPPRATERLVRTLTLEQLLRLSNEEGLPYHEPRVQALVWEFKYHNARAARALAGAYLAEMLLGVAAEEIGTPLLVPVPMHAERRRLRGHNQTETLCVAALQELPKNTFVYALQALERVVHSPTQQGLPKTIRIKNVAHSMRANELLVRGRVCVVVDDVNTTGATLEEAKRALRKAGARAVHLVALAKS